MKRARQPITAVALVLAMLAAACGSGDTDGSGVLVVDTVPPGASAPLPSTTTTPSTTVPAPPPATVDAEAALGQALENELLTPFGTASMDAVLAEASVPGVAVAVIRDGQLVYTSGHGVDPDTGNRITPTTLFQTGSLSKPVTAVAAAALGAIGEVGWDDDIADVLTSYSLPTGAQTETERVTMARLMSHRAGLNVPSFPGYDEADTFYPSPLEILEGLGNTDALAVERLPGTETVYSGGGYLLASVALANAVGRQFEGLVQSSIFGPAGMDESTFDNPLPAVTLPRATAGSVDGVMIPGEYRVHPEHAAAGLWSTVTDMARFVRAYQEALTGVDGRMLSADWARRMVEYSGSSGLLHFGHGWFLDRPTDPQWFWHQGNNLGFSSYMAGSVDGRHGLVILTNATAVRSTIDWIIATVARAEGWETSPPLTV